MIIWELCQVQNQQIVCKKKRNLILGVKAWFFLDSSFIIAMFNDKDVKSMN